MNQRCRTVLGVVDVTKQVCFILSLLFNLLGIDRQLVPIDFAANQKECDSKNVEAHIWFRSD